MIATLVWLSWMFLSLVEWCTRLAACVIVLARLTRKRRRRKPNRGV